MAFRAGRVSKIFILGIACLVILLSGVHAKAGEDGEPEIMLQGDLADTLYDKGLLTKEDWVRLKSKTEKKQAEEEKRFLEEFPVIVSYGAKGFELKSRDNKYALQIQNRFQFRYSYPERGDLLTASAFTDGPESSFEIRRARLKVGGHGYQPWVKYYFEIDWAQGGSGTTGAGGGTRLIDYRLSLEKFPWLQLRIGQWKVNYNRERVDSSGKQQFVERSIVNTIFTLDRQQGAMLYGHLFPGTTLDLWYYAGVFTGTGRGTSNNDDDNMMWMGRLQWNFLGRDLQFSQSDIEYHERPAGSLSFGATTNISNFTRFSSSGGGTISSTMFPIPTTGTGRYRVDQMLEESAFKYRGFSLQHEYHWKQIKDSGTGMQTNLMGSYAQVGYFFHYLVPAIPEELELAVRYAFVDPNISVASDKIQEFTSAANWFIAGHQNKITVDLSHLTLAQPGGELTEQRVRLQWDVSF
jgi:phosphate-selective porin OprO and OprP